MLPAAVAVIAGLILLQVEYGWFVPVASQATLTTTKASASSPADVASANTATVRVMGATPLTQLLGEDPITVGIVRDSTQPPMSDSIKLAVVTPQGSRTERVSPGDCFAVGVFAVTVIQADNLLNSLAATVVINRLAGEANPAACHMQQE